MVHRRALLGADNPPTVLDSPGVRITTRRVSVYGECCESTRIYRHGETGRSGRSGGSSRSQRPIYALENVCIGACVLHFPDLRSGSRVRYVVTCTCVHVAHSCRSRLAALLASRGVHDSTVPGHRQHCCSIVRGIQAAPAHCLEPPTAVDDTPRGEDICRYRYIRLH